MEPQKIPHSSSNPESEEQRWKKTMLPNTKLYCIALAGVVQWIEHWLANQRVTGSIPSQGT